MSSTVVAKILGDPAAFYAAQRDRLTALGVDIASYVLSHLAFRTSTVDEYLDVRDRLEQHCTANVENVWNGRRISKLLLRQPLHLAPDVDTSLIELISPPHKATYRMGLEHVGVVIGKDLDDFATKHRSTLTGQQDQGPHCKPYFVTFPDHTNVKFYSRSLYDVCVLEGRQFDDIYHADP